MGYPFEMMHKKEPAWRFVLVHFGFVSMLWAVLLAGTGTVCLGQSCDADTFDLSKLTLTEEGTHDQIVGGSGSTFRIFYDYDGKRISPWHDIPMMAKTSKPDDKLYHFLCEIPKGTVKKMEVHKGYGHNPVAQDVKKGKVRVYTYGPSLINYGAIMQTWEDPEFIHPDTSAGGDNDPVDVLQINSAPCKMGEVMPVRVLGTLALVDGGETDWKLIVVDARDEATAAMADIGDADKAKVDACREWFRLYKTADGKPPNKFGLGEKAMPRAYAEKVLDETHDSWKQMMAKTRQCEFEGKPCWVE